MKAAVAFLMSIRLDTDELIAFLNELVALDHHAMATLIARRAPCNTQFAAHPSVQVDASDDSHFTVGMLGILNGFCGTIESGEHAGWGPITAVLDDGKLIRFERTRE